MGKNKKELNVREEVCRADADEVKYMMLLNAINEPNIQSNTENEANAPEFEKRQSKN